MMGPEMTMEAARLVKSLNDDSPPDDLSGPLLAHWHSGKGDRKSALQVLDGDTSKAAAWVRAHLHRRSGENRDATEWYRLAGQKPSTDSVDVEWSSIAGILLARQA